MKAAIVLRIVAWAVCLAGVTAFSTPVANAGSRLARSVNGVPAKSSCSKCQDTGNAHAFGEYGANFDCQACNECHTGYQSGWCTSYHCACEASEEVAMLTAPRLADVAASWTGEAVAGFLAHYVDRVQYNSDRGVLQLVSCDGTVEAQYPVSGAVALALH